jgi:transcriptional regulator with XRE-family HTH domain
MEREGRQVGELIREFRKTRGLTQMKLAELVGVSYQQIQKYEKGIDNISVERLRQIAEAVDVPVSRFFARDRGYVAETPAAYGRMTDEEQLLLRFFRRIADRKKRKAILDLLKALASG